MSKIFIADFHIHSKYSIATSKECCPETLDLWARRKGIAVVGTGDFTHPAWRLELDQILLPAAKASTGLRATSASKIPSPDPALAAF